MAAAAAYRARHLPELRGDVDLDAWPLTVNGKGCQLSFHRNGGIVVAGVYKFPNDQKRFKARSNTMPVCGGTDQLQPQAVGRLAALIRGEDAAVAIDPPDWVVVEAITKAKMGRGVRCGLLQARSLWAAPRSLLATSL